eukprot:jgi/Mesvir1/18093/Mv09394-RA.1
MDLVQNEPSCVADDSTYGFTAHTACATEQAALPTLQDLAAMPGLGALIMAGVPVPDRVRLRGLCRAFASSVDASWQAVQRIGPDDLLGLDRWGHSNGVALMWLASKCPNLQALEVSKDPSMRPRQHWWKRSIADAVMTHLAAHCQHLHILSLRGCKGVGDSVLQAVAARCGELRYLDIGACGFVTDLGVSAIAAGCQKLEHLDLWYDQNVTDGGLMAVAAHCPCLRYLRVEDARVGNAGITAIAEGCPELRTLNVINCDGVDDDGVVVVAEHCPFLERMDYCSTGVGDRGIAALLFRCPQLKELYLPSDASDDAMRFGPDSCRQLRSLTINSENITDAMLAELAARCLELRCLRIKCIVAATNGNLAAFAASCPCLEELHIPDGPRPETSRENGQVTDAGVLAVVKCWPLLRVLDVGGCDGVTDAGLAELARIRPNLLELKFSYYSAGNTTVLALARHCPNLRVLDLSRHKSVMDEGLAAVLHNCLDLEVLSLDFCHGLTDAGIRMMGDSCKRLRELHLCFSHGCFTDRGLAAMAPHLGALEVLGGYKCDGMTDVSVVALAKHCPRLKEVDVACSEGVTDAGLMAIGEHCRQLEELNLHKCVRLTSVSIMAIASKCKGLRYLNLRGCAVTPMEVQTLKDMCTSLDELVEPQLPRG